MLEEVVGSGVGPVGGRVVAEPALVVTVSVGGGARSGELHATKAATTSMRYRPGVLKDHLLDRIGRHGPIPFEEFMGTALYDSEQGYFTSGSLRSVKEGDFLTSPEVSPLFGQMLARFVDRERQRIGDPPDFTVVDVGAGSGSLLRSLVQSLARYAEAWAVEVSQAALGLAPTRAAGTLDDLPALFPGVIIANELLDNLPVALATWTAGGWRERWVGVMDDRLALVEVSARPEVAAWADSFGLPVEEGGQVEVQLAAGEWLRSALGKLKAGSVVVIDYGDTAQGLAPRRKAGTLRTYRHHHLGPDPLEAPGETDITVDVNFTALAAAARAKGASVELIRQEDFLVALGLREELARLRQGELALARAGKPSERLRVRSELTDGEALLHPRGLGDFRVLVASF
ncbi:MAG: class I SAM-dependent methyltransferase [Acidimicrobiia bacterium]